MSATKAAYTNFKKECSGLTQIKPVKTVNHCF